MEYSYKFRVYPTEAQARQIQRTFGCCRYVWNHYLELRKKLYEKDKRTMNYNVCSEDMTQLKKALPWLRLYRSAILHKGFRHCLPELLPACETGPETRLSQIQEQAPQQGKL